MPSVSPQGPPGPTSQRQEGPSVQGLDHHRSTGQLEGLQVRVVLETEHQLQLEALEAPQRPVPDKPLGQARLVATKPSDRSLAREALPSRDVLIGRIGQPPKKDITLFGWTVRKMSEGYRDVLHKLDRYHALLEAVNRDDGEEVDPQGRLESLQEALKDLEGSLSRYDRGSRHTHKAEMRTLLSQVHDERMVIAQAQDQLRGHGRPAVEPKNLIAFQRVHPDLSVAEVQSLVAKGWTVQDYAALWTLTLDPVGLKEADVREAVRLGMDLATARAFHEARLPITEESQPRARVEGALQPLGKGALNSVFKGEVSLPDGSKMTGVFKAENPSAGLISAAVKPAGIDENRPQWAMRSVATSRLDQRLGLGVIPRTEMVVHGGKVGTVMGLAKGLSPQSVGNLSLPLQPHIARYLREHPETLQAYVRSEGFAAGELDGDTLKVANAAVVAVFDEEGAPIVVDGKALTSVQERDGIVGMDYTDPVLRRELTKLQWLDALTGQVDRHGQNYFVERAVMGEVVAVKGIDNDLAFGKNLTTGNSTSNLGYSKISDGETLVNVGFRGGVLPRVIDRQTFEALRALRPQQLEEDLSRLLGPEEIEAAKKRLQDIQAQLVALETDGGVLDSDDAWRGDAASTRLGMQHHPQTRLDGVRRDLESQSKSPSQISTALLRLTTRLVVEATTQGYVARDWVLQELARMQRSTPVLDLSDLGRITAPPVRDGVVLPHPTEQDT